MRRIEDPGCQQMVGYRTEIGADGACRVTLALEPRHLNRHGILHGGMAATLLDVACGNTAAQFFDADAQPPLVTVALNISYVSAARGGVLTATAAASGGGRSIAYVQGALHGEDGALVATASGIFKRIGA